MPILEGVRETGGTIGAVKQISSLFRDGAAEARRFSLAQVERVIVNLDSIRDAIDNLESHEQRKRVSVTKTITAAAEQLEFEGPRKGYSWIIKNWIYQGSAAGQLVSMFVGSTGRTGLTDTQNAGGATGLAQSRNQDFWVPEGSKVIFTVPAGQIVGEQITINLDVIEFKDTPGE